MSKRAFCVGINKYPIEEDNDLNGCVNDSNDWAALLRDHFAFTDVKILNDGDATKRNIFAGLEKLLAGAKPGDVLVFSNSSHGTYRANLDGDEPGYDEALCPYDTRSNVILDDELRTMFSSVPDGVHLTVISDSCHSGTVTRVVVEGSRRKRRNRELPPRFWGGAELDGEQLRAARKRKNQQAQKYPESGMREVLLSGCLDNQSSSDAWIDGGYHGAMSYYALQAIRDSDYKLSYRQLRERVKALLREEMFDQEPQLEGKEENKDRQIFT